jgi:4'-phosphopantetheinyl transferase
MRASEVPAALASMLDARERQRHQRLRQSADQRSYLAAHVLARMALASYLDRDPVELLLGARCRRCGSGEHGKPMVLDSELEFSLSHSGDCVALAVARGASVGIDVEGLERGRDHSDLVPFVLSPEEQNAVLALPAEARPAALIRSWSRKEAVLKAVGYGLTLPLSDLTVAGPNEAARVLAWPDGPEDPAAFYLEDLHPGPGYASCVALVEWDGHVVERDGRSLLPH